jgi:hypothetical protein
MNDNKVALYSPKNIYVYGLGKVNKGYTIVSKEVAEKWIAKTSLVKIAQPEEVAAYYGK